MDITKDQVMAMKQTPIDTNLNLTGFYGLDVSNTIIGTSSQYTFTDNPKSLSCWGYWRDYYYPQVIKESYPVYVEHRALDKGKQAFEIIKMLKDKRFLTLEKVGDFIDIMDELIKIL